MHDLESRLARCKKIVDEHSALHVLELVDQSKVNKISIQALTRLAEKDARARGGRPDHCTISAPQAFGEWVNLKTIHPYFLRDNTIGLDVKGAHSIKDMYMLWYDNAHWARAHGAQK
jgi:hypothetical protein